MLLGVILSRRRKISGARSPRRPQRLAQAGSLIHQLDRTLRRHGQPRPEWQTPLEHAGSLAQRAHPAAILVEEVVKRYNAVRFGGQSFAPGELEELLQRVRQVGLLAKEWDKQPKNGRNLPSNLVGTGPPGAATPSAERTSVGS